MSSADGRELVARSTEVPSTELPLPGVRGIGLASGAVAVSARKSFVFRSAGGLSEAANVCTEGALLRARPDFAGSGAGPCPGIAAADAVVGLEGSDDIDTPAAVLSFGGDNCGTKELCRGGVTTP